MVGLNKITLIGNLASTPTVRRIGESLIIANLRLGVTDRRKEKGEWINYTEWFNIVCFGKIAENAEKFLKKGRQIYTEGKLQSKVWKDRNGESKFTMEIIANQILFLGKREVDKINEYESKKYQSFNNNILKDTKNSNGDKKNKSQDLSILEELGNDDIPF